MFGAAVLGSGVMLVLSQRLGWSAPFYGMAGLLALPVRPTLVIRHRSVAGGGRDRLAAAVTAAAFPVWAGKQLRRIDLHPGGDLREGPHNHQRC